MWLKRFFRILYEIILDIVYPKRCAVCSRTIVSFTFVSLCSKCRSQTHNPKIVRDDRYLFDEAIGAVKYADEAKEIMLAYKFKYARVYALAYAHLIDMATKDRPHYRNALICPVPLSHGRDRLYNQTALIARRLAELWGSDYEENLLCKCSEVSPLSTMKLVQRRFSIDGSIDVNPEYDIYGRDIVVIDDIFTSGATARECARVLKFYGAARVYVLCACYD